MKPRRLFMMSVVVAALGGLRASAEDTRVPEADLTRAAVEFTDRLKSAASALHAVRTRIVDERAPLSDAVRAQEERVRAAEAGVIHLETLADHTDSERKALQGDLELATRNIEFVVTQAREALTTVRDALLPGEDQMLGDRLRELSHALEGSSGTDASVALDAADLVLAHVRRAIGGHAADGKVILDGDNRVTDGRFVFFGPEVVFLPSGGAAPGVVRLREGAPLPVVYPVDGWDASRAGGLFEGGEGAMPADGSGGKALRFLEATGTLWTHLSKGGMVGYIIIALGFLGVAIALFKIFELAQLSVDEPGAVQTAISACILSRGTDAEKAFRPLGRSVRELLSVGVRHFGQARDVIEEHLYAQILQQRMRHERRLPLLAVIVTASPLLGLLGTVTGMVKTFTLITIYGTGNAARLSSGISEALVTTELGLIVAIPILVVHGYLSHRMRKNIAMLERYSYEFITANDQVEASHRPVAARTS